MTSYYSIADRIASENEHMAEQLCCSNLMLVGMALRNTELTESRACASGPAPEQCTNRGTI